MLAKDFRLRKDQEIKTVLRKGKSFYSQLLSVKFLPNKQDNNRFCFVISNKISKKAGKRNLVRRRLQEIIRKNLVKIKGNYDIVVMPRAGTNILEKKSQDLEQDLFWVLGKIGLFKQK